MNTQIQARPVLVRSEVRNPAHPNEAPTVCCLGPVAGSSDYEVWWVGGVCGNGDDTMRFGDFEEALEAHGLEVSALITELAAEAGLI